MVTYQAVTSGREIVQVKMFLAAKIMETIFVLGRDTNSLNLVI